MYRKAVRHVTSNIQLLYSNQFSVQQIRLFPHTLWIIIHFCVSIPRCQRWDIWMLLFLLHKMEEKITKSKGEHWDHKIKPIQRSLRAPTVLHFFDLSCQNVTPTAVKCRSTIHDWSLFIWLGGGGGGRSRDATLTLMLLTLVRGVGEAGGRTIRLVFYFVYCLSSLLPPPPSLWFFSFFILYFVC